LACLRREAYTQVQKILKRDKKERMPKEEFDNLFTEIGKDK